MEAVVCHFRNWSPDLCETLVSCLGHSTLFEHVVTDVTEDLKLLNAGQGVSMFTIFHDLEHVRFVGDHGCLPWYEPIIGHPAADSTPPVTPVHCHTSPLRFLYSLH